MGGGGGRGQNNRKRHVKYATSPNLVTGDMIAVVSLFRVSDLIGVVSVSYTHLTLPTKA